MSCRMRRRCAVRICQRVQCACERRILSRRGPERYGKAAGRRGQTHAPCEASPRQSREREGAQRSDRRRLQGHPATPEGPRMIKAAKKAKKPATKTNEGGSAAVDAKIKSVSGWRGEMLGKLRKVIREAAP